MDRNRDYRGGGDRGGGDRGGRNPPGIPGGVSSFDPWQRGGSDRGPPEPRGSDRGPPEPRSSSDRRSRERHVPVDFRDFPSSTHNRSPPRPHRRSRSPGKWFRNISSFFQNVICSWARCIRCFKSRQNCSNRYMITTLGLFLLL